MRVIYILWLRQLKRYLRSTPRIIGSLGQPLLFLVALGFGFGPIFQKAGGGDYIQFITPGIIAMSVLFTSMFSGIEVIWDRQFGFLKETLVAPVSRLKIMFGRTLGGATVSIIQGLIVLLISFMVGFRPPGIMAVLFALVFMILIAMIFTGLGTAIASLMDDMHGFQLIVNFLLMPLFFLSGALFPLTNLPPVLNVIVNANPLAYGVDGLRWALTGASHFALWHNLLVLTGIATVFMVLGAYLFSKIEV